MADGTLSYEGELGTIRFRTQREQLKQQLEEATAAQELAMLSPDTQQQMLAGQRLEIAKKQFELFHLEHDKTGALKPHLFGGEVASLFDGETPDRSTSMIRVSMAELDRLNKQGGHELGDRGMTYTYQQIAASIEGLLMKQSDAVTPQEIATRYSVYRTGGNEFTIILKDGNDPKFLADLSSQLRTVDAIHKEKPNVEAPPLAVTHTSVGEVMDVLKLTQQEMGQDYDHLSDREQRRITVDIAKELLDTENDIRKTALRLDRFESLVKTAPDQAKDFYDNFLKKALGNILNGDIYAEKGEEAPAISYEEAVALLKQMGGFSESWATQWQQEKARISFDAGFQKFRQTREATRGGEQKLQQAIGEHMATTYVEKLPRFGPLPREEYDFTPKQTRGLKRFEELQASIVQAEQVAQSEPSAITQNALEIARIDLQTEKAKRDTMTGLESRGMCYEDLQSAFQKDVPITTVFIDMAFLKYFDKVGGSEAGDLAIKKSGSILDSVVEEYLQQHPDLVAAGLEIKAFRYAGDEFTLTIKNGKGIENDIIHQIHMEAAQSRVPKQHGSRESYKPESIVFNVGVSHCESRTAFEERIQQLGLPLDTEPNSSDRYNQLAEYAIKFADKEIDLQKAMDRFDLLFDRMSEPNPDSVQVEQLLVYSQKAIFGAEGQKRVEAYAEQARQQPQQREAIHAKMRQELLEFVIAKKQQELVGKHERDQEVEGKIEAHVREGYFERRITQLMGSIQTLETKLASLEQQNDEMKKRLLELKQSHEEEMEGITQLRAKLKT